MTSLLKFVVQIGDFGLATFGMLQGGDGRTSSLSVSRQQHTADQAFVKHQVTGYDGRHRTTGVGTVMYTSPEQDSPVRTAGAYDDKVDMFALGIIFFEM